MARKAHKSFTKRVPIKWPRQMGKNQQLDSKESFRTEKATRAKTVSTDNKEQTVPDLENIVKSKVIARNEFTHTAQTKVGCA